MRRVFDALRAGESPSDETADRSSPDARSMDRQRGQSPVLGLVLLVGIVVAGSALVFLVGASGLEATESAVEIEHAEDSLLEFTHATHTAITTDGEPVPVSLGSPDHGTIDTREDAGRVRIAHETPSGTDVLYNDSLGALRYTNGETELAFQGGSLWRSGGDGSVLVSAPPLEYRGDTLRFPIVRLTETSYSGGTVDGAVRQSGSPTHVELQGHNRTGEVAAGVVRIEIESTYCDGWQREIETKTPGRVIERCEDGQAERVRFELAVQPTLETVDSAIAAHEIDVHQNAPRIDGDVRTNSIDEDRVSGNVYHSGYDYPSVDAYVSTLVAQCATPGGDDLEDELTEPGQYCVDTIDGDHTFDTSNGDIVVVVRDAIGDPQYTDDLRVEGDNDLTVVVDGDVSVRGNAILGNRSDPGQTQVLVSSTSTVTAAQGTPTIAALVYAPESTVSLQGNPTVEGSIVADRVEMGNIRPGGVAYDDRIATADLASEPGSFLRYLDVTGYELAIDG